MTKIKKTYCTRMIRAYEVCKYAREVVILKKISSLYYSTVVSNILNQKEEEINFKLKFYIVRQKGP